MKLHSIPFTAMKFIPEKRKDWYCCQALSTVGVPGLMYSYCKIKILYANSVNWGRGQEIVPKSSRTGLILLALPNVGWSPGKETYVRLRAKGILLSRHGNDIQTVLRYGCDWVSNLRYEKQWRPLQLVPENGPFHFVTIRILATISER